MPFDFSRPNPLGLSPEQLAIFDDLLAWLDNGGDDACRFDYTDWIGLCGTSACIGGWLEMRGAGYNGLTEDTANELFFAFTSGPRWGKDYTDVTAPVAASCVRRMLATGEVDWPLAFGLAR